MDIIEDHIVAVTSESLENLKSKCLNFDSFCGTLNDLGELSGIAQKLNGPITSIDKLKESNNVLYVHKKVTEGGVEVITGYIKAGYKNLFFYTAKGKVVEMSDVPVCLDFFVHPDHQRHGIGKKLFDFMLQAMSRQACEFAYDRPSSKLTPFLWKHYNLCHQDVQPNRYAIYPREGFPLE